MTETVTHLKEELVSFYWENSFKSILYRLSRNIKFFVTDTEILIFIKLKLELTNLPITLKELWLTEEIDINLIKISFGCKINFF